uniref:Tyrosine-protein phosphatase domain-containing protein n=1 Tax=Sus scrofa TaxID=9823 RepID=A0A8D1NY36_PIG
MGSLPLWAPLTSAALTTLSALGFQVLLGSPGFFPVWVRLPVLLLAPDENRSSALVYLTVSALSCSEIAPRLRRAGEYLIPESVDLECVKYCVVYDNNTSSLEIILKNNSDDDNTDDDNGGVVLGAALECGRALTHLTRHPVHILRGGYECFSAMYHFFRTQKSIWMPQELDAFQPYPVEIVPGKIYLGNFRQACDPKIQKDLKIKAHVNVSMEIGPFFVGDADKLLHIPIEDSPEANISPFLRHLCHFIEMHLELGSVVLVFSTMGISRSCAAILAYLMHRNGQTLKRSWTYVKKCKNNMRPNRALVAQLSEWEKVVLGDAVTDILDPLY